MFGYVLPSGDYLDAVAKEQFQGAYCGLCHTLGRYYGWAGCMILNYDMAFLAMLLSEGQGALCTRRCALHPVKGRACSCGDKSFDTAAHMSVVLTWWQLRDGIADHGFFGSVKYRLAALFLRRAYRKARAMVPDFDEHTRLHLEKLAALEKENCASIDAAADAFASLLAGAAQQIEDEARRRILQQLFYHLGRWIYLIDAVDDLAKDVESGSYNPLVYRFGLTAPQLTEEARHDVSLTLDSSVRAMAAAFELWNFGVYNTVIESTVYHGLYAVGTAVLDGTFRRVRRSSPKKEKQRYA